MQDGIILIDKPMGWTSHDVVAKIRSTLKPIWTDFYFQELEAGQVSAAQGSSEQRVSRTTRYDERVAQGADAVMRHQRRRVAGSARQQGVAMPRLRVGHAGTLDPMATGLLIVLVGKATKQQDQFMKLDKWYEAEVTLGATSTTDDGEGEMTRQAEVTPLKTADVLRLLDRFKGKQLQLPPKYSAIKIDGKRAYRMARSGEPVEVKPRPVTVHEIKDVVYRFPHLSFNVHVSSGTYIRSLARDIGAALEVGGYLSALRRTTIGTYSVTQAIAPDTKSDELLAHIQSL